MSINLDNNATTSPAPEVVAAMTECLQEDWGNPSSTHRRGIAARRRVELARESVAGLLGCEPAEVVFTSGGTEAANLAVVGGFERARERDAGRSIVACAATEHPAVRDALTECVRLGAEQVELRVDTNGVLELPFLERLLAERGEECALVSLMWANNETGVVQPIERAGELCREHGVLLHTDAVQWVGRMACDFRSMPVDLLSCSAHKFHGPKGAGALLVRKGVHVAPRALGGLQERERRGGTENVPAIAGLGVACDLARAWLARDSAVGMLGLRDRFEERLEVELGPLHVHARDVQRLWNTTNIAFPGIESQFLIVVLSERGLAVSGGAACASGSVEPSGVLVAMGASKEIASGSIRFSTSRITTEQELEEAAALVIASVQAARASASVD